MNVDPNDELAYEQIAAIACHSVLDARRPTEGWIRTARMTLRMSGAQLARRLGVSRAMIARHETTELTGHVTLKTMTKMAEAMHCRFVYAVIPDTNIQTIIGEQARYKATAAAQLMAKRLAIQGVELTDEEVMLEVERLTKEMTSAPPNNLWDEM